MASSKSGEAKASDEAAGAAKEVPSTGDRVRQLVLLATIVWIALIGIFAIEQIEARDGVLRVILAQQAELGAKQGALVGSDAETVEKRRSLETLANKLESLRQRSSALILTGSVTEGGSLPEIECELIQLRAAAKCRQPSDYQSLARRITLQPLTALSANGALFAVLVITAALGGAVIRLSLEWDRNEETHALRSIPRAIGGGIVCYLILGGGKFPLSALDVSEFTDASTGSLCGLLAGMFSDKVFHLLKDLFTAFVARLTPAKEDPTPKTSAPVVSSQGQQAAPTSHEAAEGSVAVLRAKQVSDSSRQTPASGA